MNTEKLGPRLWTKLIPLMRLLAQPELLRVILRGENVGTYLRLRRPWLQQFGFQTIVDVGANKGQFAALARLAFPHATLHCFEPLSDCYRQLRRRFQNDPAVSCYEVALAEDSGASTLVRNPFSASSSLLQMNPLHVREFPFTKGGQRQPVRVSTLDQELARANLANPVLIKIDVQGAEHRVIAGGRTTLSRAAVVLLETSFELLYEGQVLFDETNQQMKALGFRYHGNLGELVSPIDGRVLQSDAIFVRASRPSV